MSEILSLHSVEDLEKQIKLAERDISLCDNSQIVEYLRDLKQYYDLLNRVKGIVLELTTGKGSKRYVTNIGMLDGIATVEADSVNDDISILNHSLSEYVIAREVARRAVKSPLYPLMGRVVIAEFPDGTVYRGVLVFEYSAYPTYWAIQTISKTGKLTNAMRYIYNVDDTKVRLG